MAIVTVLELDDSGTHFFDVPEDAAMNGLLLQRPVEALGDAVGLRLGDEGETRSDTPEPDLVEEVVGRVLRAVIHAQRQAEAGIGAGGAELGLEPLSNRLQRREAVAGLDGAAWMPTQQASK